GPSFFRKRASSRAKLAAGSRPASPRLGGSSALPPTPPRPDLVKSGSPSLRREKRIGGAGVKARGRTFLKVRVRLGPFGQQERRAPLRFQVPLQRRPRGHRVRRSKRLPPLALRSRRKGAHRSDGGPAIRGRAR